MLLSLYGITISDDSVYSEIGSPSQSGAPLSLPDLAKLRPALISMTPTQSRGGNKRKCGEYVCTLIVAQVLCDPNNRRLLGYFAQLQFLFILPTVTRGTQATVKYPAAAVVGL